MGCGCAKRARKVVAVAGYRPRGKNWVNSRTGHTIPDIKIEHHHTQVALSVVARSLVHGLRSSARWQKVQWECVSEAMATGESCGEIEQRAGDFLGPQREVRTKGEVATSLGVTISWMDNFTSLAMAA